MLRYPLTCSIALRYAFSRQAHKFAFFVAILAALGIAIGVSALITVSAVMQGLQDRLKSAILATTPHVVVTLKQESDLKTLLELPQVSAALPFVQGEVLLQSPQGLQLATLQGYELDKLQPSATSPTLTVKDLGLLTPPTAQSYALLVPQNFMLQHSLVPGMKIRLIATQNARYTPLGLTPTQRLFTIERPVALPLPAGTPVTLIGAYDDVRRLLRTNTLSVRLFLHDPFLIEDLSPRLQAMGFTFSDWRATQGDFFKAVALEKLSMSVMLCLIIVTAAFNILSALTMLVSARLHEIAVLKTLGLTRGKILTIFMCQGLICAACGVILGIILGLPLALNAQSLLTLFNISIIQGTLPVTLNVGQIVVIALSCLALAALCTLYPALKAAACDPSRHLASL